MKTTHKKIKLKEIALGRYEDTMTIQERFKIISKAMNCDKNE